MSIILVLVLLVLLAALAGIGFVAFGALAVKRNAAKQLEVVKGVPSKAPPNWVGAHSPEAKLHQRMLAAVAGLRDAAANDATMAGPLAAIEQEAIQLDGELVAVSRLGVDAKSVALTDLEAAVGAIEHVVIRAVSGSAGSRQSSRRASLDQQIEAIDDRLEAMRQARAEVDGFPQLEDRVAAPEPPAVEGQESGPGESAPG